MAYEINKTNGSTLVTLEDNTVATIAGITLVGRSRSNYGESFNENLVKLLENFANSSAPASPLTGQLWWDTANSVLNIRTGTGWSPIGNAVVSPTEPAAPSAGTFWYDSSSGIKQLKVYDGVNWQTVGPELPGIGGSSGLFSETVEGNNVLAIRISSTLMAIISATQFAQTTVPDFPSTILPGINFRTNGPVAEILTKTVNIKETAILPVTDNVTNLGSGSNKWANVYATTFTGALSGNASTATSATSATTATNATNIAITSNVSNSNQPLVFVSTTTGNLGARVESNLTYNPDAGQQRLTVPNITATTLTVSGSASASTFTSTVSTGTPPLTVTSTTKVANLYADRADKWATARTITLSGDVTGSVAIDGTGDVTLSTTVAANSVALGTDTTGNYVASMGTPTNGISISGGSGEASTPVVGIDTAGQIRVGSLGIGTPAPAGAGSLTATGTVTLGSVSNVKISGGSSGQVLSTDGSSNLSWVVAPGLGVNQSWQDVTGSRVAGDWYLNNTGKPIYLSIWFSVAGGSTVYVGPNTVSYASITQDDGDSGEWQHWTGVIPINHYYQAPSGPFNGFWECR